MKIRSSILILAIGVALTVLATPVHAQIVNGNQWPVPRLNTLSPTGGKVGTTLEVTFSGTEVEQPDTLLFNHPGIKGVPIVPPPPPVDPKAKTKPDPKKMGPPAITKFSVTIAADVPPGEYDARLVNKNGISNPRRFVVGVLNEVAEKEPNNDVEQAQKIEPGTTINGTIAAATDVDYFSFPAKKGQRILVSCATASIDSKLDPEIRILGAGGKELSYFRPSPGSDGIADLTIPEDGDYLVRLNKFTYTAGGVDYFYRLTVAAMPYIDAVFPPVIEPGKTATVTVYGRNLPGGKLDPSAVINGVTLEKATASITAPGGPGVKSQLQFTGSVSPLLAALDGFEYRIKGPMGVSNRELIGYASAPVIIENDDNDTPEKAQAVSVPCEIAGRIDKKRDRDWYVFDAKKGDVLMIEVLSHRLGAPTDMYFVLRNLATKQEMVLQDDTTDSVSFGFYTANRDPLPYRFVAPADGKYHLMLASHTGDNQADPTHMYRVRITPEQPDFRLIVMPSDEKRPDSCRLGQGGLQHFTVYALRRDGFRGDITLSIEGLPTGVTSVPQVLSGNMKLTQLVVAAADNAPEYTGFVKVVGTAVINGAKVVHEARPASVVWGVPNQQNIPTITRLNSDLALAVRDKAPGKLTATMGQVAVSLGDKIEIPLKLTRSFPEFKANFQVATIPGELPTGMTFANLTFAPGKDDLKAVLTVAANTVPGTYNVTFRGFASISPNPKGKGVNTILISTPVQVTVLPKQVATLTVDNANPTIKTGAEGAISVRVARLFNYDDAFKVELVLPPNAKGLSADKITIAPGTNEAKMTLRIVGGTPPGNLQNLIVRATAVVNGNVTLVHETKINVNIAK